MKNSYCLKVGLLYECVQVIEETIFDLKMEEDFVEVEE